MKMVNSKEFSFKLLIISADRFLKFVSALQLNLSKHFIEIFKQKE